MLLQTSHGENNAAHLAVERGEEVILRNILHLINKYSLKHVLEVPNQEGYTPLHLAVINNDIPITRMLLKEGASVSSRDLRGNTALHLAVNNSTSSNIIDNIFTAGPQSRANDIGLFPIHVAVQTGNEVGVQRLVEQGEDVDAREKLAGRTPLHLALDLARQKIAKYLVEEGEADLWLEDYKGRTCRELLMDLGLHHLVQDDISAPVETSETDI